MKRFSYLLILILLPFLVACGSSKSDDDDVQDKNKPLPICPQVAIVHELDTLRDYGTEKPDRSQLVAVARMETVHGDCEYQKDGIDIAFDLNLIAAKGPRLGGNRSEFPFFIAVVDPDENIIEKKPLSTVFKFGDDRKNVEKTEPLHVFIPMPKQKRDSGPLYQVLIGFQLTQAQLDTVRKVEPKTEDENTSVKSMLEQKIPETSGQEEKSPETNASGQLTPGPKSLAPKTLDQELPPDVKPELQNSEQPASDKAPEPLTPDAQAPSE